MPYQVLARKYRPLRFSDVVGQDHVTRTLLNALAQDRIAHGYIFSGHRGIGKTTIARILASALNCRNAIGSELRPTPEPCNQCESCLEIRAGNAVDVIEIDAATNRGIDEVRELRDAARYRPSRDKYKIIILDEAHQITDAAFNALLKTLEEPPEHIVFMFATTQPEDIPQTIRSRCQHFSFHAVKLEDIVGQLRKISTDESIDVDDSALALLAEAGDGSMRDALSIMDQAIASAPLAPAAIGEGAGRPVVTADQIRELMGTVSNVVYEQILQAVNANSSTDVLATINRLLDAGNGPQQLARQFVRYLRNCTVAKVTQLSPEVEATGVAADLLQISSEERRRAARSAAMFTEEELSRFLAIMLRTFDELGYRQEPRFHLELGLLKLVHAQRLLPVEELLSQLAPGTVPTKSSAAASTASSTPAATRSSAPSIASSQPVRPSPLEADRNRRTPVASIANAETPIAATIGSLALATEPTPVVAAEPKPESTALPTERPHLVPPTAQVSAAASLDTRLGSLTSNSVYIATTTARAATPPSLNSEATSEASLRTETAGVLAAYPLDLTAVQTACVAALEAAKGQGSAAHTIDEATLTVAGDTLEVQTGVSKAMLPAVINAEAERILAATIRQHHPGLKLKLLPGTPANHTPQKSARPAVSGSAAELAARHPLVQQAQQLFGAEISNVIDLRGKN